MLDDLRTPLANSESPAWLTNVHSTVVYGLC